MPNPPEIFVIAGPNGAGKSTVAGSILPKRFPTTRFLNADDVARALAITSPVEASRVMLDRMYTLRDQRETFAFETTLAARSLVRFLRDAQHAGYSVHIAYVWVSSIELAIKRVAVRVRRGGHDVPEPDIRRRYFRGLNNFFKLYLPLANRWVLCDNSGVRLVVVARGRKGDGPTVYDRKRFERIQHAARQD